MSDEHPMNVDEEEYLGEPVDEVPKLDPTAEDCRGKKSEGPTGEKVFRGYCRATPGRGTDHVGEGRCKHHGGAANNSGTNNGNYRTGAFSKHFTSHLTSVEQDAFDEAREALEDPEGAQDIARTAATSCLMKYRRTGDERFLRRFEGLCDKFGIAPDDELTLNLPGVEEALLEDVRRHHDDQQ